MSCYLQPHTFASIATCETSYCSKLGNHVGRAMIRSGAGDLYPSDEWGRSVL